MSTVFQGTNAFAKFIQNLDKVPTTVVIGAQSSTAPHIAGALKQLQSALPAMTRFIVKNPLPRTDVMPDTPIDQPIIGIGGGKVMDIAKALSLGISKDRVETAMRTGQLAQPRVQPLSLIPTTCGSGSEATHFAVCYLGDDKYSFAHKSLLPDSVVLDPQFVASQSAYQTKIGALDAVCQSIESQFSKTATAASRKVAQDALPIGLNALRQGTVEGFTADIYGQLQQAAFLAGQAINVTKTNLPHGMSYYLTTQHGVSHGLAVAFYFEAYLQDLHARRSDLDRDAQQSLDHATRALCNSPDYRTNAWTDLLSDLDLMTNVERIKPDVDAEALIGSVNVERLRNFCLPPQHDKLVYAALDRATAS